MGFAHFLSFCSLLWATIPVSCYYLLCWWIDDIDSQVSDYSEEVEELNEDDVENEIENDEEQDEISSSENEGEETEELELEVFIYFVFAIQLINRYRYQNYV